MRSTAPFVLLLLLSACGMTGKAHVTGHGTPPSAPPKSIWVGDFTVATGAVKSQGGILGEAEAMAAERPHILGGGILGGGGPVERRTASDNPTADEVIDELIGAVIAGLRAQDLGVPVERLGRGSAPSSGWLVHGELLSVDPGNRTQRAIIGFGAGEATTEVAVDVDRLEPEGRRQTILTFGGTSDSGKMPGAVVTMNPYVAAAKFVLGRQATAQDVQKLGNAIAAEIAKEARAARAR
ncbi:MAG TPA: DUF4410 domain-containing protein [Candidatus Binatia bacterium]|jgi:hypothetical protein|nr:DUF4410 domain-containing protein [Candidatus Binatia bacterium]